VRHFLTFQPFSQIIGDLAGPIITEQAPLMAHHLGVAQCLKRQFE
jgi:hypothetical protein